MLKLRTGSSKLAGGEGKTTSQMVRELIENYRKERDIGRILMIYGEELEGN